MESRASRRVVEQPWRTDLGTETLLPLGSVETRFDQAPKLEQKELIRKVIEKIEVNPDKKLVRCYIRRVPKVPAVEEIRGKLENLLGGGRSANGNRTRI